MVCLTGAELAAASAELNADKFCPLLRRVFDLAFVVVVFVLVDGTEAVVRLRLRWGSPVVEEVEAMELLVLLLILLPVELDAVDGSERPDTERLDGTTEEGWLVERELWRLRCTLVGCVACFSLFTRV